MNTDVSDMKSPYVLKPQGACRRLYLLTFALLQCLVASGHALCSETIPLQPLAIPVSSFGAVAVKDSIFVFGGHTAPVHEWSKMAVTGKIFAMDMGAEQPKWHPLESCTIGHMFLLPLGPLRR